MLTMLKNWNGPVEVNGKRYENIQQAMSDFKPVDGQIKINLFPASQTVVKSDYRASESVSEAPAVKQYRITVKKYMTEQAKPNFDFMLKWNHDIPMPLRTMTGTIEKETKGMVYMKLHGDIYAQKICTCMKCGRTLTNPVSQYFGIGPECGGHNYVNPFEDEQQLREAVSEYRKKLQAITWEGWVIKSAITEQEEVR